MKVLFLDIDGVLNRDGTRERCGNFTGVDKELAKRLTDFLKGRGAGVQIVLSSAWRNHPEMWAHLNEAGIQWIDRTPRIHNVPRGAEIAFWLANHQQVKEYVILDDMTDMLPEQQPHFVNTDWQVGLTPEDMERVGDILKV